MINIDLYIETARKSHSQLLLETYKLIKAAFLTKEKEHGKELTFDDQIKVLQKMVKERQDSMKLYKENGRDELAQKEQNEIAIISVLIPEEPKEEDIQKEIDFLLWEIEQQDKVSMKHTKEIIAQLKLKFPSSQLLGKMVSTSIKKWMADYERMIAAKDNPY